MEEDLKVIIKKSVKDNIKGKSTKVWADGKKYYISFEFEEIPQVACQTCGKKCDGDNKVIDQNVEGNITVCNDCLNDFGNQDYDSLTKKLENIKKNKD